MAEFITLADARQAMKGSFIGTVIKAGDLKSGTTNGKDWTKKNFTIEDVTGQVELTAWGDEINRVKVGCKYEFTNPWWKNYEGEVYLAFGKYATVKLVGTDEINNHPEAEASQEPKPEPESTTESPKFPLKQKLVHDEIWAFAISEATKVYPLGTAGSDPNLTGRLILAQVFYKKNMDYYIHREGRAG